MYRFGPFAAFGARAGTDQPSAVVARQRSCRRTALRTGLRQVLLLYVGRDDLVRDADAAIERL